MPDLRRPRGRKSDHGTGRRPQRPQRKPQANATAALLAFLRALRAHVEANFEHVGDRFAEEARKIHYGEAEPRDIYGEATREEVESLLEEGIDVHPLPWVPKLDG